MTIEARPPFPSLTAQTAARKARSAEDDGYRPSCVAKQQHYLSVDTI